MHTRERVVLVTVRVNTLIGVDAGAYYVEALGDYYLDSSEPRGLWHGQGAERLGLAGEVDNAVFLSLMAGLDPVSGEPLGRRYGERSVRGFDVTASAPKSVSVLFALGDAPTRRAVLEAHDAAVAAMVGWVEAHAHTRYRVGGEVMIFDAEGIVAASFRQHTSRALDPQLHTHVVIPNRVMSPDGRWLALDARTIKVDQRTLSAVYHAGLRAELTRALGVRWREPTNGIAELADVPDAMRDEFSSRTRAVQERIEVKLDRFVETFERRPTPRERWRLEREAVTDSRPSKRHGVDAASLHAEWAERAVAIGDRPQQVVAEAVGTTVGERALPADAVTVRALDALEAKQSAWRPAELVRELAAAVPTDHAVPAADLMARLDRLGDEVAATHLVDLSPAVPSEMPLRRDGRPITESALDRALTTPAILAEEEDLVAWAELRLAGGGDDAVLEPSSVAGLSGPQREVAATVAGGRGLVLVVGPAGTGKTTALAPAVQQLRSEGRPVFGVAPSAAAAEVLATETSVPADTVAKLLVEHRLGRPPAPRYDLPAGSTVIVDEAAMVTTDDLAELSVLAEERGWRVALVGDPLQFSGVGRSGMFAHLVEFCGAIELDRVRRFTSAWERKASLRLRRGDAEVLGHYEAHGHLHEGSRAQMEAAVMERWWQARERGERAAMMAPTNETVVRLNQQAQAARLRVGELNRASLSVRAGEYGVLPGDEVATRRNDRQLLTDRGLMVKNRDRWAVDGVSSDGSLTVTGQTGTVTLPPAYVAEHVELAYAQTSHANQGRTVDRSLFLLDGPTDSRGVYVPMTRGRLSNDAFVVVEGEERARDVLARALVSDWIDRPAIERRAAVQRPVGLDGTELRRLFERRHAIAWEMAEATSVIRRCTPAQRSARVTRDQLQRAIAEAERCASAARDLGNIRSSPFKGRRRRTEATARLTRAEADIEKHRDALAKVDQRLADLGESLTHAQATQRGRPRLQAELDEIEHRLRADRRVRARGIAADPPDHILDPVGRRPERGLHADQWDNVAARIDQHHAAFGVDRAPAHVAEPDLRARMMSEHEVATAIESFNQPIDRGPVLERTIGLAIEL